jgi:hypothetical protein
MTRKKSTVFRMFAITISSPTRPRLYVLTLK